MADMPTGFWSGWIVVLTLFSLAGLAWAPPAPANLRIGGAVRPSTNLIWDKTDDPNVAGYKVYWRLTTSPTWDNFVYVPADQNGKTLEGIVIDNYYFGVSAVGHDGNESPVVFPLRQIRRR